MAQVQVSDLTEILELKNVDFFHIKDGNDNIDKKFAFSNFLLPASNPTKQTVDSLGGAAFQNIVPVSMGGTGADNQATARNNLGLTSAATTPIGAGEGDLAVLGLNGFFSVNRIPNLDASKITSGVLSNTVLPTDIVRTSRTLTGGDGINTIGNLSVNRTISVDSTVARLGTASGQVRTNSQNDGRFALRAINLTAGDGLTGGGNLTANRSFAVDSTVARYGTTASTVRTNSQNDGRFVYVESKSVTSPADSDTFVNESNSRFYLTAGSDISVDYGSGPLYISGSGTSLTHRWLIMGATQPRLFLKHRRGSTSSISTVEFYSTYNKPAAADVGAPPTSRTITAGDGLTGGGNLTTNRSFAVDSTVARLGQANTFSGINTFSDRVRVGVPINPASASTIQVSNAGSGERHYTAYNTNGNIGMVIGVGSSAAEALRLYTSNGTYGAETYNKVLTFSTAGNATFSGTINGGALIVSAGAVGSYTLAYQASAAFALKNYGDTQSGSNLTPADVGGASNGSQSSLSGTWVCLGNVTANFAEGSTTLWQRIS